ncbi:Hpt domain-containing protein [Oceanicaulis sp. LC35]|uniref:Hpt domain-containing protein n=1 Tax=Oceanicaulis sp. LC35 TaxID=3349635 RepID=UPI003F879E2C
MAKPDKSVEIINPPNMLKAKVGGKLPPADQAAIERAEMALGQIKHQFQDWLAEEVTKMEALMDSVSQDGLLGESGEMLFTSAHDLRGLGATYEFPIISRISGSLAKLIETKQRRSIAPIALVRAHAGAIRAALIQNIRSDEDPVGRQLAQELESQVIALVGAD